MSDWSYGYTASSGFATDDRISVINNNIDTIVKNRISTRVEGDCVTFTFSAELSDDNKIEMNKIVQDLVDTSKPKNKSLTVYPKIDSTDSTTYVLMGRISYKKITPNQTLDYIDIMAKGDSTYSVKIMCNKLTLVEFMGNNAEFEILDMGNLENTPIVDSIIEVYAKVDSGSVYIDQLQLYYNS